MTKKQIELIIDIINNRSFENVLEIGSRRYDRFNIRDKIINYNYTGYDIIAGTGVDITNRDEIKCGYYDLIICSSVLEHDVSPKNTMELIKFAMIKNTGIAIITVPFYWWIHNYPNDYRRYTPDGLSLLMKGTVHQCFGIGNKECPHTVVGLINFEVDEAALKRKYYYADGIIKGIVGDILPPALFRAWKYIRRIIYEQH